MKLSRLKQALFNDFSLFNSTDKMPGHFLPGDSNIIIPIHQNSATANFSFSKSLINLTASQRKVLQISVLPLVL